MGTFNGVTPTAKPNQTPIATNVPQPSQSLTATMPMITPNRPPKSSAVPPTQRYVQSIHSTPNQSIQSTPHKPTPSPQLQVRRAKKPDIQSSTRTFYELEAKEDEATSDHDSGQESAK